jgi:release factor glutamine methyltransferase
LPSGFVWSLDRSTDVGRAMLAATRRLREEGCDSPQLDSAVLMMHVLGVNKAWLYAHPYRRLSEAEISQYEALVRRRICHEPIAYLVGRKAFYGLDLIVARGVLIPRPETELLVERVLDHLRYLALQGRSALVADIGAGSGAIAVALAVHAADVQVFAVDISAEALAVADQNIRRHGVGHQVQLLAGNLTDPLPAAVDVIVANLPYVATPQLATLPPTVRDYEPIAALDGGPDGLRVFRAFFNGLAAAGVHSKLRPGGRIYLEIGADQGQAVKTLAGLALPGAEIAILPDYAGLDRMVVVAT